jgi:hypothetical protein
MNFPEIVLPAPCILKLKSEGAPLVHALTALHWILNIAHCNISTAVHSILYRYTDYVFWCIYAYIAFELLIQCFLFVHWIRPDILNFLFLVLIEYYVCTCLTFYYTVRS